MANGAKAVIAILEKQGVSRIFGYPGAAICPLFDALVDSCIDPVLVRHEQSAGHMASGYARVTGKPAVCVTTSGPGALNLITAIATAYMDSIPLVVITGQVESGMIGRDVFQEADITGSAEPFVKHSYLIKDINELAQAVNNAFLIAGTGRRGPVLIDIPIDILLSECCAVDALASSVAGYKPDPLPNEKDLKAAVRAIKRAKKPILCVGGGLHWKNEKNTASSFAEQLNIPVVSTLMGLSVISPQSPLCLGMIGMHGHKQANNAIRDSDLIILAGARVGDRAVMSPVGISNNTTIIHIDIDPAELNKNIETDIAINGDCNKVLVYLQKSLSSHRFKGWATSEMQAVEKSYKPNNLNPTEILQCLNRLADKNAIIVADVGQNQIWAARSYSLENGRFLTSGGMGTMGYSLPCAIGCGYADPNRQIIVVCGDGGFQMSMMELATLKQSGLPLKIIILNNRSLGMIKELQDRQYGGREIAVSLGDTPSYTALATAYGIESGFLDSPDDINTELERLLTSRECYLLECAIDKNEKTLQ